MHGHDVLLFVHDALARLAVAVSDQVQKVMAVMVALVALGAIPVRAADIAIPVPTHVYPGGTPLRPVSPWTGCDLGAQFGGGWAGRLRRVRSGQGPEESLLAGKRAAMLNLVAGGWPVLRLMVLGQISPETQVSIRRSLVA